MLINGTDMSVKFDGEDGATAVWRTVKCERSLYSSVNEETSQLPFRRLLLS